MDIPLSIHLLIHFFLAMLSGYAAGRYFKKIEIGILVGFAAGFLVDLDHVLEYALFYGWQFNLSYFLQGRQFLLSDQIHLWLHAWEYAAIFVILGFIFKPKSAARAVLITAALALSVHLLSDTIINRVPLKFYSLSYRAAQDFSARNLMSQQGYEENLKLKAELGL